MKQSAFYGGIGFALWLYVILVDGSMQNPTEQRFFSLIAVLLLAILHAIKEGQE